MIRRTERGTDKYLKVSFEDGIVRAANEHYTYATIECSDLSYSDFRGFKAGSMSVEATYLYDADFSFAEIKDAKFTFCSLEGAKFRSARLENVTFEFCDLTRADFSEARLTNVRFIRTFGACLDEAVHRDVVFG